MGSAKRERLFEAMLAELAEGGYEDFDLARALARCGVSRDEFATEFEDEDACLFAAYEHLTNGLLDKASGKCDAREEWPQRIRCGLEAVLSELAARPEMARVVTGSFPAIRPAAYLRYMGFLEAFVPFFRAGREFSGVTGELPGEVEMLAIGAAETIVADEIEAGRAPQLPAMLPSILFSVLVPFLGPEAASAAMRNAQDG
jgi:AcrR family transcriptional regulator